MATTGAYWGVQGLLIMTPAKTIATPQGKHTTATNSGHAGTAPFLTRGQYPISVEAQIEREGVSFLIWRFIYALERAPTPNIASPRTSSTVESASIIEFECRNL
jgi:hypothetical protein